MKKLATLTATLFLAFSLSAQNAPEGLTVNQQAPDFSANTNTGATVSLANQLKKGKVVLVFYRGQWCPYCNKQLAALEDSSAQIIAKGASIFAVTPEIAENISKTVAKTKASYPILHDRNLKIMTDYKVAFPVDSATIARYKKYKIDFDEVNGENGANLPVPAVYIIDQSGKIIYRYFNPDYSKRPSVKEILSHL